MRKPMQRTVKMAVGKVTKSVAKMTTQPSRAMNFSISVPVERYMYRESKFDNPEYWDTEYGYLGQDASSAGDSAVTPTPPAEPWYQKLIDIYGAYKAQEIALKNQNMLAQENAARVARGQQAIDMQTYMQHTAPQINIGISPMMRNIFIYGGIGLAAILIIPRLLQARGRR